MPGIKLYGIGAGKICTHATPILNFRAMIWVSVEKYGLEWNGI